MSVAILAQVCNHFGSIAEAAFFACGRMPFRRLIPIPAPVFAIPNRQVWLQLLGTRTVAGRVLLFLKLTEPLGTVTYYVVSVDIAWG